MDVSPRGYRAWRNRLVSASQRKDQVELAHIRDQFEQSLGSYGRPRMAELAQEGCPFHDQVEVDESYLDPTRQRGRAGIGRGRGVRGKVPVFGIPLHGR